METQGPDYLLCGKYWALSFINLVRISYSVGYIITVPTLLESVVKMTLSPVLYEAIFHSHSIFFPIYLH
jgi:hypothetical protein